MEQANIRYANEQDIDGLVSVWKQVFGDEEAYIRGFLQNISISEQVLCYEDPLSEGVVAMLYLLPCDIVEQTNEIRNQHAGYLYALATLEEYRGAGIMGEMIRIAIHDGEKKGMKTFFLIPAEENLFQYYDRFDFAEHLYPQTAVSVYSEKTELSNLQLRACTAEDLCCLLKRNDWNITNRNVIFEKALEEFYVADFLQMEQAFAYECLADGESIGFVMGMMEGGRIEIFFYAFQKICWGQLMELIKEKTAPTANVRVCGRENRHLVAVREKGKREWLNGLIPV
ncbi:MAG: GNAT family N-acetyltransferase [Lachnospiraceae bacterium]|nr:GNAT family N-acetyltransferase [Lachnospiraceae bacterium]